MDNTALEAAAIELPFEILAEEVTPELLAENKAWALLKDKAILCIEERGKSLNPFSGLERSAAQEVLKQLNQLHQIRESKLEYISFESDAQSRKRLSTPIVVKAVEACEIEDYFPRPLQMQKDDVRPLPYTAVKALLESGAVQAL